MLGQPDLTDELGLRDRAMMEVLYSTGIRRHELAVLQVFDVDAERGTVTVRLGKGRKDRVVPIGDRALFWLGRYQDEVRPGLVLPPDDGTLFLSEQGERLSLGYLTNLMKDYVDAAKLGKTGACHIFRHSMATAMLDAGADVRIIQEILGHADMSTTAIYTRIAIRKLKAVHEATHPAAKLDTKKPVTAGPDGPAPTKEELLAALNAEAVEEEPGCEGASTPAASKGTLP